MSLILKVEEFAKRTRISKPTEPPVTWACGCLEMTQESTSDCVVLKTGIHLCTDHLLEALKFDDQKSFDEWFKQAIASVPTL